MSIAVSFGFATWLGIIAVWLGLLVSQLVIRRRGIILLPRPYGKNCPSGTNRDLPSVCVVIPARNESREIAGCLESVLCQDYPRFSVVVVDDRSTDDTAEIAARFARRDSRVRVITNSNLPPGWLGKSRALWLGARGLSEDWILFLDADCRLDPWALSTAIAEAIERRADLFSLWPRQAAGTFWEHMTIPLCAGIIALWFGSRGSNSHSRGRAFANGQFVLIRREPYERIGGHEAVKDAIIEDVPFAEYAGRSGLRCFVAGGRDLVSVRMYRDFRSICDGWARIYAGALRSSLKISLSIQWLVLGSLLPYVSGFVLLAGMAVGVTDVAGAGMGFPAGRAAQLTVCHLLLLYIVSWRFWGMGHCPRKYLWLYPVSAVVVSGILCRAFWWLTVRRAVPWRGTDYLIDGRGHIRS